MIFLDMDGVLCNFVEGSLRRHGRSETHDQISKWEYYLDWGITAEQFWEKCSGIGFWSTLKEYPWAGELYAAAGYLCDTYILTSPSTTGLGECIEGKRAWLLGSPDRIIPTAHKHLLAAPGRVLVDDSTGNIEKWIEHGGIGLGVKQPWNNFELDGWQVIKKLKELMA